MLKVVAKCLVKTEEISTFKQYTSELIEQSRKEAGNISYALYEDIENPQILTFIEEWRDKEALEQHMTTKHFSEIFPKLKSLQQKAIEINLYKEA